MIGKKSKELRSFQNKYMRQLYPLLFKPIFKDKIWGGTKLKTVFDKKIKSNTTGESWEISTIDGNVSVVRNGEFSECSLQELIREYKSKLLGKSVYSKFGDFFPLLIKYIDANEDLSVQVHPNDLIAKQIHNSYGKTEMWYVCEAESNAVLITGFNEDCTALKFERCLNKNTLSDILKSETVIAGESFFIPAGTVHAIGKGVLLAEIQQASDVTYRIFDYNRRNKDNVLRDLHLKEAKRVINYLESKDYKIESIGDDSYRKLVNCAYFTTNELYIICEEVKDYSSFDSFVIYMCVAGELLLESPLFEDVYIKCGDTLMIPACINRIHLSTKSFCKILEIYIN